MARPPRALLLAAPFLPGGITLFFTVIALDDALIALNDRPTTATVLEVGHMQRSRSGLHYDVRLSVPQPSAAPLEAWADRALKVTGSWSGPPRRPEPGDTVPVYVGADPPRIVPASTVSGFWGWVGPLGFGWALTIGMILAVRSLLRAPPSGGTRAGDP